MTSYEVINRPLGVYQTVLTLTDIAGLQSAPSDQHTSRCQHRTLDSPACDSAGARQDSSSQTQNDHRGQTKRRRADGPDDGSVSVVKSVWYCKHINIAYAAGHGLNADCGPADRTCGPAIG